MEETRVVTTYSHKADGMVFVTTTAATDEEAVQQLVDRLNEQEEWCEAVEVVDDDGVSCLVIRAIGCLSEKYYNHVAVGVVDKYGFCQDAVIW